MCKNFIYNQIKVDGDASQNINLILRVFEL